jgi:hypothetical protein
MISGMSGSLLVDVGRIQREAIGQPHKPQKFSRDETRDMLQPARAAQFSKRGFQVEDFVSWPGSSSR